MDKKSAYRYLLEYSKSNHFDYYSYCNYLCDSQNSNENPPYFDYDGEMNELYKILNNKKQREIVLQSFELSIATHENYSRSSEIVIGEKYHLYHDTFTEDIKERIATKYIEFDTAIGLIVNLYNRFLRIQNRLCTILPRINYQNTSYKYDVLSIDDRSIKESISCFDEYLESLKQNTDIDIIQEYVCNKIDELMSINQSYISDIDRLLSDQWVILGIANCLHYDVECPSPSLSEIYEKWNHVDCFNWIYNLNEIRDDELNEYNLETEFSRLSFHMFYVLRTVLAKKLYDYYKYFSNEKYRSE